MQCVRFLLLVAAAAVGFAGCTKSPIKLYPVKGKVLFQEQPAEGAQIVFQPTQGATPQSPLAYGTVESDGAFALHTDPYGNGAAAGDYVVMVTWYAAHPRDPEKKFNRLPAKYADPATPLVKATVKEGSNDLEPFRLKP